MGIAAIKSHMKVPSPDNLYKHTKKVKELSAIRKGCFSTSTNLLGVDPDKQSPSASSEVSKMVDEAS